MLEVGQKKYFGVEVVWSKLDEQRARLASMLLTMLSPQGKLQTLPQVYLSWRNEFHVGNSGYGLDYKP